jgi:hypothetical protein
LKRKKEEKERELGDSHDEGFDMHLGVVVRPGLN